MQKRAFNRISVNYFDGKFTKSSCNTEKLQDEINYYLSIPEEIAILFPRFINYKENYSAYTLEYLPYNTLEELILKNSIVFTEAKQILQRLLAILEIIHQVKPDFTYSAKDVANFYIIKTVNRINDLAKDDYFKNLLAQPLLKINGKQYKNFFVLEHEFNRLMRSGAEKNHIIRAIHGDFCFSNILYSPQKDIIKLIDPRGSFNHKGIYGHVLYDYAKLMHCLHSKYDYIVNDQFNLYEYENHNFYFVIPSSEIINDLLEAYINELINLEVNVEFIFLIEASLFLSMISLHYENKERQKIMYLTGIILLNQVCEGKYAYMH